MWGANGCGMWRGCVGGVQRVCGWRACTTSYLLARSSASMTMMLLPRTICSWLAGYANVSGAAQTEGHVA